MFDINLSVVIWYFGKLVVLTLIMAAAGVLMTWMTREKTGAFNELEIWPQDKTQDLVTTFFYLMTSFVLLILATGFFTQSAVLKYGMCCTPMELIAVEMAIFAILSICIESMPYAPGEQTFKIICWFAHSLTMAPALSFFGDYVHIESMLYASYAMGSALFMGFAAPKNIYHDLERPLAVLHVVVAAATMTSILLCPYYNTALEIFVLQIALHGGMILYFLIALAYTQGMILDINKRKCDPIHWASVMLMSTINIYLRITLFLTVDTNNFIAVGTN